MMLPDEMWKAIEPAPGWCWREKADRIYEIASEPFIGEAVEIGVYGGRSFLPLVAGVSTHGGRARGFDIYEPHKVSTEDGQKHWDTIDYQGVHNEVIELLKRFGYTGRLVEKMSSEEARSLYWACDIQYVHIDGSHRPWDAVEDIIMWSQRLSPRGFMLLDDTHWSELELACALMKHGDYELLETLNDPTPGVKGQTQIWRKR